jgi:uncharacterized protein (DUF1778 family)
MKNLAEVKFNVTISRKQKEFFKYAAALGGYKTLDEFIIHAAQLEAERVVKKHHTIIASEKDGEVFFNALNNPPEPSERLKEAAKWYKDIRNI